MLCFLSLTLCPNSDFSGVPSSVRDKGSVLLWIHGGPGRDKKDAEASKTASSPYNCTAETVFGGRKIG